jgi:hypothetical protein
MSARQRHVDRTAPWERAAHAALKHRLGFLLAFEAFAIFALAPLIDLGLLPHPLLAATFSLIILAGIAAIDDRALARRVLVLLGLVLLPLQFWRYAQAGDTVVLVHLCGLICYLVLLSASLAKAVFTSKRIKMDQVLGGVVLYLNIGLTFATIYALVEVLVPGSFHLADPLPERPLHPSFFNYFSLVTLTTVGYGDIVPAQAVARALATLEAAIGQLYPAIILARLVSIEVTQRDRVKIRSEHRQQAPQDRGGGAGDL